MDEQGRTFESRLKEGKKSLKLKPVKLDNGERTLTEFTINEPPELGEWDDLKHYFTQDIKPFVSSLDYKEQPLVVTTEKAQYSFDNDQETLIKEVLGKQEALGCGKIVVKSSYKKKTKTKPESIVITVELTPDYQKDYEIIPYHRDPDENQAAIAAFMAKYITKPPACTRSCRSTSRPRSCRAGTRRSSRRISSRAPCSAGSRWCCSC